MFSIFYDFVALLSGHVSYNTTSNPIKSKQKGFKQKEKVKSPL